MSERDDQIEQSYHVPVTFELCSCGRPTNHPGVCR